MFTAQFSVLMEVCEAPSRSTSNKGISFWIHVGAKTEEPVINWVGECNQSGLVSSSRGLTKRPSCTMASSRTESVIWGLRLFVSTMVR